MSSYPSISLGVKIEEMINNISGWAESKSEINNYDSKNFVDIFLQRIKVPNRFLLFCEMIFSIGIKYRNLFCKAQIYLLRHSGEM